MSVICCWPVEDCCNHTTYYMLFMAKRNAYLQLEISENEDNFTSIVENSPQISPRECGPFLFFTFLSFVFILEYFSPLF